MEEAIKIACVQVNAGEDIHANITVNDAMMRDAIGRGAKLIALPENAYFMRGEEAGEDYTMEPHPGLAHALEFAKEHRCHILIGSIFVTIDTSGKWANRSILINDKGELEAHYDKIHLFDADFGDGESYQESARFLSGKQARLAEIPCGQIGMTICYDVRFARLYRDLARCGATIYSVPAAFAKRTGMAHWHVLLRARAIENGCYVIAPNQCGVHPKGRETYGHSMIINPWGEVLAEAGDEPEVIMAEVDPEVVANIRRQMPVLTHDRDYVLQDYAI
ncbi:MAG: carbon-nitrogen hydrolase family protein [Rickettsiales bacterium]|nr:carbon-nitrogen hydrolase family protein [Rickettsiales bacterium]